MLSYLQGSTRMEISMSTHQFNNPRLVHGCAIRRITKYLASTYKYTESPNGNRQLSKCGVFYMTNTMSRYPCYVDAEFVGGWDQEDSYNEKKHVAYRICDHVRGMTCFVVQQVTDRYHFNYNISGLYCVNPGNAQNNTFNGSDEVNIIYLQY